MKMSKIGKSLLISCLLFGSLLALCIGVIGYITYDQGMTKKTNEYSSSIINYVINNIDAEALEEAINNTERTDEIIKIEKICDKIKQTHNIEYIYIVKPLNFNEKNNIEYILSGESLEDRNDGYIINIGELSGDEYTPDVVKWYMDNLNSQGKFAFFANTTEFGYMYTAMKPILNKNNEGVAVLAVDIIMDDIITTQRNYLILISISALIITIIFISTMFTWLNKRIIKPVSLIEKSTNDFVALSHANTDVNNLIYNTPDIHTKDEIESLSNSVSTMASDLKTYMLTVIKTENEKKRIETELNVATQIQASMLPSNFPAFPNDNRFDIFATMHPAKEVGGDFYDFFKIDDTHLAIVVADVSGKGVPAALFMVIGKTLIKDHSASHTQPGDIFTIVNNMLCEANSEGLFITAFEGILDLETGELQYVNAGHEMPYIYRKKDGEYNAFQMKAEFVLAGLENKQYHAGVIKLEHGDKIFQYTDGVTEATNSENELYGMDRLKTILDKNIDKNPHELLPIIKSDIDEFVGSAPQFDDITMLSLELK